MDLFQRFFGSVIRFLLAGVVGWLVQKGVIEQDMATELLIAIPVAIAALAWSYIVKARNSERFKIALQLPAHSTAADVEVKRQAQKNPMEIR